MIRIRFVVFMFAIILLSNSNSRGERVGFNFSGALQVGTSGTTTIFGVAVAKNAPLKGTFSYDTTAPGVGTDVKTFNQSIDAGYTLDIDNGKLKLSASDFRIIVANDFQRQAPAETDDTFDIKYDSRFTPPPSPLLVNGVPWSGSTVYFMIAELSWPSTTFTGPDEPQLTSDRPTTPGFSTAAFSSLGSSASPKLFNVTSVSAIVPTSGDYNRDGKVSASDYTEWRRVFGGTSVDQLYADYNGDGIVDAADYVGWRHEMPSGGALSLAEFAVPEPAGLTLLFSGIIPLVICSRKSTLCRDI